MLKIEAVLFDFDGVLIDSNAEIAVFWKQWALKQKVEISDFVLTQHVFGRTTQETINVVFPTSTQKVKEQIRQSAKEFDLSMHPAMIKGARAFFHKLYQSQIPLGLVTSSSLERAQKILERYELFHCFRAIITGEEVQFGKPNPEAYLKMSKKINCRANRCLVFEDSTSGIESALDAGMHVIAIGNKNSKRVKAVIEDFDDVIFKDSCLSSPRGAFEALFLNPSK
ncbi:MAG: HAD family phosphatase [Flavisolibacter sp.]